MLTKKKTCELGINLHTCIEIIKKSSITYAKNFKDKKWDVEMTWHPEKLWG